jgi:hypothetical protein
VHPFLMSWKLQPTAARKNKLAEIFKDGRMPTCSFDDGRSQIHLAYADEAGDGRYQQMIYVYESVGRPIDPESLRWGSETPAPVASYDLGGARLSVLTAQGQVNWPSGCDDRVAPSPESTH